MELSGKDEQFSLGDAEWGKLPDGHVVGKPVPLFHGLSFPSKASVSRVGEDVLAIATFSSAQRVCRRLITGNER
jgi:hypothetical protein